MQQVESKKQRYQVIVILLAMLLLAASLTGCGASAPSEADARAAFEKQNEAKIKDGTIKVTRFKKINGQSGEFLGVKIYSLQYEAEIEYLKEQNPQCKDGEGMGCGIFFSYYALGAKEVKTGEVLFEKTENGWRMARIS